MQPIIHASDCSTYTCDREAVPVQRAADGPFTLAFSGARSANNSSWAMQGTPIAMVGHVTPYTGSGLPSFYTIGLPGNTCLAMQVAVFCGARLQCSCKRTASRSACSGGGRMWLRTSRMQPWTPRLQAWQLGLFPSAQAVAGSASSQDKVDPGMVMRVLSVIHRRLLRGRGPGKAVCCAEQLPGHHDANTRLPQQVRLTSGITDLVSDMQRFLQTCIAVAVYVSGAWTPVLTRCPAHTALRLQGGCAGRCHGCCAAALPQPLQQGGGRHQEGQRAAEGRPERQRRGTA